MKNFLLSTLLLLITATCFGQLAEEASNLNFDTAFQIQVKIDTVSYPNNIWQIGTPQKTLFTSASSFPNAIVTDTINPYPVNDTSVFVLRKEILVFKAYVDVYIYGKYFVNSDTLTDYGKIEFSRDNGISWIDPLNDDPSLVDCSCWWDYSKPTLTGNSNGWRDFSIIINGQQDISGAIDTILYRFTFISDGVQTNKDGLMFDDFYFENRGVGIEEIQNDQLISVYPNPANDHLSLKSYRFSDSAAIQIINYQGQLVYEDPHFRDNFIDIRDLANGLYLLRYSDTKTFAIKNFVVNR